MDHKDSDEPITPRLTSPTILTDSTCQVPDTSNDEPLSGTCETSLAASTSERADTMPEQALTSSRKRKFEQLYRLTKKQCVERLGAIEENLQCPICQQKMFCPFVFPCGEHLGVYSASFNWYQLVAQ